MSFATTFYTDSPEQTAALGARLGANAAPGDVLCLIGELGAGKTHFAQGIAEGLGIAASQVTSPTYALIAEHYGGRHPLYHMDAYRLNNEAELGPLGYDDYVARRDGVLVIEWADRISGALPVDRVEVAIEYSHTGEPERRSIAVQAVGVRSAQTLERLITGACAK